MAALAKVPVPKLCPTGFIFIWIEKQHISAVVKQLARWGFVYIENLTWVHLHANNSIMRLPSDYAQRSHLTLFLFRKDGAQPDTSSMLCVLWHRDSNLCEMWADFSRLQHGC